MTGTRRTTILATAAAAVPLLARQIVAGGILQELRQIIAGGILHGLVGGNESLTRCDRGRGLTAAFGDDCALEATLNQIDPIEAEEGQSGEGGSSRDAEAASHTADKDEDYYYYVEEEWDEEEKEKDGSTITELWYELECDDIFASGPRPLHNHTTWMDLRLAYERTVGAEKSTLSSSTSSLQGDDGFAVPHRIVQLEGKGRGIVAAEPIRAGQWIWTSHKTARFLDAPSYRRFLRSVPVDLACDVLQWAYVQEMGRWTKEELLISVDLDDGSYCNGPANEADSNTRVAEEMGCDAMECRFHFFAAGDIAAGEEIICDYSAFAITSGWAQFDL